MQKLDQRPWYREPMMWLVIALPASSVVAGLTTLMLALRGPADPGLAVPHLPKGPPLSVPAEPVRTP